MRYVRVRIVLSQMYDIYCVNSVLCYCVFFMMQRINGTVPQCKNEDVDEQFPADRIFLHGASPKGSCSTAPTIREIHNRLLAPFEESYINMLCYIMRNEDVVFTLSLEHDPEIEGLQEFFMIHNDIKDMIVGE